MGACLYLWVKHFVIALQPDDVKATLTKTQGEMLGNAWQCPGI